MRFRCRRASDVKCKPPLSRGRQSANTPVRRLKSPPPDNGVQTGGMKSKATHSEAESASSGLQYIKALTALLALLSEAQREKLVDLIIQEKII